MDVNTTTSALPSKSNSDKEPINVPLTRSLTFNRPKSPLHDVFEEKFHSLFHLSLDDSKNWTTISTSKGVFSQKLSHSPIDYVRGTGVVDFPLTTVVPALADFETRSKWDPNFKGGNVVKPFNDMEDICRLIFNGSFGVSGRDFILNRSIRVFPRNFIDISKKKKHEFKLSDHYIFPEHKVDINTLSDEFAYMMVSFSPDQEEDHHPKPDPYVRATCHNSAIIAMPHIDEVTKKPTKTKLFYLSQVNLNGWIPNWVINKVNQMQPMIIRSVEDYLKKVEPKSSKNS